MNCTHDHTITAKRAAPATAGMAAVVVLNGLLIIRPEELLPELGGVHLYQLAILVCMALYSSKIFHDLSRPRLTCNPLFVLILVIQAAVVMSHVANNRVGRAVGDGEEFLKLVVYYQILIAAITSRSRLRMFLNWLLVFITFQTTLALAQYYGYIDVASLAQIEQREFNENSEVVASYLRLCGTGIYNDPNVLCLLLTMGMLICLSHFQTGGGILRVLWLITFAYFGFALTLTQSRGGLLAAAAGLFAFVVGRFGGKRGLVIFLAFGPLFMLVFEGRQAKVDLSSGNDTSQGRIQLWSEGLDYFPTYPVFGIGAGEYADRVGLVAHNSFVQAFVELGAFGGFSFLAVFLLAIRVVATTRPAPSLSHTAVVEVAQFRLIVLGILASYMMGMFSLTCNYIPPTYLTLALATVYIRIAAPDGVRWFVTDGRMFRRVLFVGVAGFVFLTLFVKIFVKFD